MLGCHVHVFMSIRFRTSDACQPCFGSSFRAFSRTDSPRRLDEARGPWAGKQPSEAPHLSVILFESILINLQSSPRPPSCSRRDQSPSSDDFQRLSTASFEFIVHTRESDHDGKARHAPQLDATFHGHPRRAGGRGPRLRNQRGPSCGGVANGVEAGPSPATELAEPPVLRR